jgi:regulator of nucleoside diphosphate kinase
MSKTNRWIVTTTDYAILRNVLTTMPDQSAAIAAAMREKLANATIVPREKIDPGVVTLNSRVLFRVGNGSINSRVVVHDDNRRVEGLTIPVTVPLGLALLGLAEGQECTLRGAGRDAEKLQIVEVAYQPEATELEAAAGSFFREMHSRHATADVIPFKNRSKLQSWLRQPRRPDDDPDPSAA